jgi:hypothetical protein
MIKVPKPRRTAAVLTVLTVAVSASALCAGTATAAAAHATAWPSGVARPAAVKCAQGRTLVAPTSGWTDALGVSHFSYRSHPGLTAVAAPRGLTASQVTPALLNDLGLPKGTIKAGPGLRGDGRSVQKALALAKNQTAPAFCMSRLTPRQAGARLWHSSSGRRPAPTADHYNGQWGGYSALESGFGSPINSAAGDWHVGAGGITPPGLVPSGESTWVGVGGGIAGEGPAIGLIQLGTSLVTGQGYQDWWEYIGTGGGVSMQFENQVRPNDAVAASVDWTTPGLGACFDFTDFTTSKASFSVCQTGNLGIPYDHTSAEWVNEWISPYYEGYPTSFFQDPGPVYFTDQKMTASFNNAGPWHSPFSYPGKAAVLAVPGTSQSAAVNCNDPNMVEIPINGGGVPGSSEILDCPYTNYE